MIETSVATSPRVDIDPAALDVARAYIAVIVERSPLRQTLGPDWADVEAERLLRRFVDRYAGVASGPYAKHGKDALRVALSGI